MSENTSLGEQIRGAQQNLRLSAGTINKLNNELKITCNENEDLKKKIQQLSGAHKKLSGDAEGKINILSQECERLNALVEKRNLEIRNLGGEVHQAQENLRLSAQQTGKMANELNDYKGRLQANTQESETYKLRLQKLLNDHTSLTEEMKSAQ